jgi:hypothetical protein
MNPLRRITIVAPDQIFANLLCNRLQIEKIEYDSYLKFEDKDAPELLEEIAECFQGASRGEHRRLARDLSCLLDSDGSIRGRISIIDSICLLHGECDLVICASMNEESWSPRTPGASWLHPFIRQKLGLPSYAQLKNKIEVTFQGLINQQCSEVILTRSKKIFGVNVHKSSILAKFEAMRRSRSGYQSDIVPNPEVPSLRAPAKISKVIPLINGDITLNSWDVELLMSDPEAFFAKNTLGLPSTDFDARRRDISAALKRVVANYVTSGIGAAIDGLSPLKSIDFFSYQRGVNIIRWLESRRFRWTAYGNVSGQITICGKFMVDIRGDADIIEDVEGGLSITMCRMSANPPTRDILFGTACRVLVLCLIARDGGFAGLPTRKIKEVNMWSLNGAGDSPVSIKTLEISEDVIDNFRGRLIDALDGTLGGDTPSKPQADHLDIYKHFKRS